MKMNDTVARIVEIMFQDVEVDEEVAAIRDEVMDNCQARYTDLVNSGMTEDEAIAAVIESLKGMEDVLAPYKRKVRHAAEDEVESSKQHAIFAANEVQKIDLCLVSEDVTIEASDDENYHVLWDAEETPLVLAAVENGVLKIDRSADTVKSQKDDAAEQHHRGESSDFVRTGKGKIEINLNAIDDMLQSVAQTLKNVFSKNHININIGFSDGAVTIQVPKNATPHMKLLTTSGDIDVQSIALADLNVISTSGDIDVDLNEEQHLQQAELRTTSGDIDVSAFVQELTVSSTSGDVEVEGCISLLAVSTISGDIDVRANVQNITFKSISGDVDLQFDSEEISDVQGSTISGDIDIDLPDGIGTIAINTQTRSGDVTTRHHTNGFGPTVTGSVSSMSGDIMIS